MNGAQLAKLILALGATASVLLMTQMHNSLLPKATTISQTFHHDEHGISTKNSSETTSTRKLQPAIPCNDQSNNNGTLEFVSRELAHKVVKDHYERAVSANTEPVFIALGRELLDLAERENKSLLTLQVGGMDGKTGDPMYKMMSGRTLSNWVPVVVEPLNVNYEKLTANYQDHATDRKLSCSLLLNQAISYNQNSTTCSFCHYDAEKESCRNAPNWKKYEIGSLDCAWYDKLFPNCKVQKDIPCYSIAQTLAKHNLASSSVSILQMDVEGFEKVLIPGYFSELTDPKDYPLVINFESRILAGRKQLDEFLQMLREKGYTMSVGKVDTLALLNVK